MPNYAELLQEKPQPTGNDLQNLSTLTRKQLDIEASIADHEGYITELKGELKELQERQIPDVMMQIGVEEYTLSTGEKVSVKEIVEGSIAKDKKPEAFTWLRQNEFGDLIKNTISIAFDKDQDALADKISKELIEAGLVVDRSEGIHGGTFKSFVKEQIKDGLTFPPDLFSIFQGRKAKITKPKT